LSGSRVAEMYDEPMSMRSYKAALAKAVQQEWFVELDGGYVRSAPRLATPRLP
jgi:hypothetical protein